MTGHAFQLVTQDVSPGLLSLSHVVCGCGWAGPGRASSDPHQLDLLVDDETWHRHEQGLPCAHPGCLTCHPEPTDPAGDIAADLDAWLAHETATNLPNLRASAVFLQMHHPDPDPRMALQLGYAILLGKPLIFLIQPGTRIPDGLVRAADALIEWTDDQAELHRRLGGAIGRLTDAGGGDA